MIRIILGTNNGSLYFSSAASTPTPPPPGTIIPKMFTSGTPTMPTIQPVKLLTAETGFLSTPNYPETYPNDILLKWKIICPSDDHTDISISFLSPYGIAGKTPDCLKDHLTVRHPENNSLLHTYCHRIKPVDTTYPYDSVNLEFYAGHHHDLRRKGFNIQYTCRASTLLTSETGFLSTPNHPVTYPNNIFLRWKIICPSDDHTAISISFLSPYGIAGKTPDCLKDHLTVRKYKDNSLLDTYCHRIKPADATYPYNSINLEFYAGPQHDPRRKGFKLQYTCSV